MLKRIIKAKVFYISLILLILLIVLISQRSRIGQFIDTTPMDQYQINTNLKFTNSEDILAAITNSDNKDKGYFSFNTKNLVDKLDGYSWIKFVMVNKVWPNTVNIRLQEYKPYAIWTDGNKVGYITEDGKLFYSPKQEQQNAQQSENKVIDLNSDLIDNQIPVLISNQYYIQTALNYWLQVKDDLDSTNLSIKEIRVDSSDAWQILLSNGILLNLDSVNINESIRRFLLAAEQIKVPQGYLVDYVDLRYNNGISIKFIPENLAKNVLVTSLVPGKGGQPLYNANFSSEPVKGNYTDDLN
ncbi:hypothetical protein CJP74_03125 [Psittacicella melopsittaci]|uniref:POTRA domain-containing protein n=1 Tax=Psittacicella melopsittaci TaxID=2028576 RepID=A0A3A1YA39_9GAMM|nr:cell division protein FtsQ/DivIB [Psittacicella melopsittaci]RIY32987.1 hypothetical protein CJP74_03125 [Psittacicella melopsittaci]